jgi:ankyrin repeat protein
MTHGHRCSVVVTLLLCVDVCRAGVAPVTGIHGAAKRNELGELRRLLDRGMNPNKVTQGQITALMWAAAEGHVEAAQMLIAAGADTAPKSSCEHHCFDHSFTLVLGCTKSTAVGTTC